MYQSAVSEVFAAPAVPALAHLRQAPVDHPAVRRHVMSETLPFTVRVARGTEALAKAVAIRHEAYARHLEPTMTAALHAVRAEHPARLVCAVPVASREALDQVRPLCDELVCLQVPAAFEAVGQFYAHFEQVSDETVSALLADRQVPAP